MHPEYYSSRFYRKPRRFLWFILGGLAATWLLKHKECRERGYAGFCIRKPVHAAPGQDPRQAPSDNGEPGWAAAIASQSSGWDEEKVHALRQQAGDTITEMLESTLDTTLSTVEVLKAKLAEHRAQREAQKIPLPQGPKPEEQRPTTKRWV